MIVSDFNKLAIYTPNGEVAIYKIGEQYSNGVIEGFEVASSQSIPKVNLIATSDGKQRVHMSVVGLPFALLNE